MILWLLEVMHSKVCCPGEWLVFRSLAGQQQSVCSKWIFGNSWNYLSPRWDRRTKAANMLEMGTNVGLGACLFTKFFKLDCLKHHFPHSQDRNWLNSIFDFKKMQNQLIYLQFRKWLFHGKVLDWTALQAKQLAITSSVLPQTKLLVQTISWRSFAALISAKFSHWRKWQPKWSKYK